MTPDQHGGADRVGGGDASLGEAQSSNPPDDPDMLTSDAGYLDTDVDGEDDPAVPEERDNEDPAPNMPWSGRGGG